MTIKPLSDHILIEPIKEEEKTKAGIFLPEQLQKKNQKKEKLLQWSWKKNRRWKNNS